MKPAIDFLKEYGEEIRDTFEEAFQTGEYELLEDMVPSLPQ